MEASAQPSLTRRSGHYSRVIDRPKWTRATPPMTSTQLTSPMRGVIWRRGGARPAPRDCTSGTRGDVVVRDARDRPAPSRCAVARCGDPSASPCTRRTVHHDHSRDRQRGCSGTRFRPDPAPFGGEPGLGRKRLRRSISQPPWPTGRHSDARHLRGPRGRGRLLRLTRQRGVQRHSCVLWNGKAVTAAVPGEHGYSRCVAAVRCSLTERVRLW